MNPSDAASLTSALGGKWHGSYGIAPCPVCQPERRADQAGLTLSNGAGRLLAHCHKSGCDFTSILAAAGVTRGQFTPPSPEAQREADAQRQAYEAEQLAKARRLWDAAKPIEGTKGEAYLRGRGITCALPPSLRWLPDTYHAPSGRWVSAMVARVSSGGVHRTFFAKDGKRLDKIAKMMLGPCSGGAVQLTDAPGAPLAICEGIETGLSLASGILSTPSTIWAALSTSGLRAVRLPDRPGRLIVAMDGDEAGRAAGDVLARRAKALGWSVSMFSAPDGVDWNDILQMKGAAV